jgi:phosphatidylglycerophosphate synthase
VTSELAETELRRVALRAGGESAIPLAERLLAKVTTIPITVTILRRAGALTPSDLRSLDAIHLATALSLDEVVAESISRPRFYMMLVAIFAGGHFLAGFLCAYGMSVLDSVDGKLARLTFTDSKLGNVLDHGLDLVHPPFWYCAWAYGLSASSNGGDVWSPVFVASLVMLVLYVIDRLILKVYPTRFGRGLHTHAAIDGLVRTFIQTTISRVARHEIGFDLIDVSMIVHLVETSCRFLRLFVLFTLHARANFCGHLFPHFF